MSLEQMETGKESSGLNEQEIDPKTVIWLVQSELKGLCWKFRNMEDCEVTSEELAGIGHGIERLVKDLNIVLR